MRIKTLFAAAIFPLAAISGLVHAQVPAFAAMSVAQMPTLAQVSSAAVPTDSVAEVLRGFSLSEERVGLNGVYVTGNTVVVKGDSVMGPVVAVRGNADIYGYVGGGVYSLWGDVTVHEGGEVVGGVNAFRGRVIVDGGTVRGSMHGSPVQVKPVFSPAPPITTARALQISATWTGILIAIGLLVLAFASPKIEATAKVLEEEFGRALFFGVLGQLGFLPAVVLVLIALAATVIGILLIPFALVAAPIAFVGLIALGWLALALLVGRTLGRKNNQDGTRTSAIRSVILGVLVLMVPWILASLILSADSMAMIARAVALGVTWVAATAGLGATLISRAGSGDSRNRKSPPPIQGWQTPTPVAGVTAARRPIPARPGVTPR